MTKQPFEEPDWLSDPQAVRQLTSTGELRAALNFGNPVLAQRDPATGEPRGVSADLARGLAQRLGVSVRFKAFETAGKIFEEAQANTWDVAFMAIDPVRAVDIYFTDPYVLIEGTYLVQERSSLHHIDDIDRSGVRVAVGEGAAYDLFLSRALHHASIVRFETSQDAIEQFAERGLHAAAGVRQPLETYAREHAGFRVLDGCFEVIKQAMCCPRGRDAGAQLLDRYLDFSKNSGLIKEGLRRSGQGDTKTA